MDGFTSGEGGVVEMTFWVYALQSLKDGRYYVGNTQDIEDRVRRRNAGDYRYTKGHRPWKLVYRERVKSRSEAVKLERFFKTGVGRKILNKNISQYLYRP